MRLDNASETKLNQVVAYLNKKSGGMLWARLYQKIIFLLELESYKKHQQLSIGVSFKSYYFGPFSVEIAQSLENSNSIKIPDYVKAEVDGILQQYGLNKFDNKHQEQAFNKIIDYIHSLYIYHITPFEAKFDFNLYDFKDLFKTISAKIDGQELEQEKYRNMQIDIKAKEYESLFE